MVEQDRFFDSIHVDDCCKVILKYVEKIHAGELVPKQMDLVYTRKYLLSDIAKCVTGNITVLKEGLGVPYVGSPVGVEEFIGRENITSFENGAQEMEALISASLRMTAV